jgi:hypothetical protein
MLDWAMAGKAIGLKVGTERSPALTARYGVQSIPNFVGWLAAA